MAGFESPRLLFPLGGRVSGLRLRFSAASSVTDPVVIPLGGFAGSAITALSDGDAFAPSGSLNSTPNPVITSMAGFESPRLLFPLGGRFSGLTLRFSAASSVTDPVVIPLGGFAGSAITALSDGDAFAPSGSLNSTPNPVITSMAGFESSQLLFPLGGRLSGLGLRFSAASSVPDPVVTPLAGFAGSVSTALSDEDAFAPSGSLNSTPNPVITSMAGFESSQLLFPLGGRLSGLRLRFSAVSSVPDPLVTPLAGFAGSVITCMAGFGGPCRDHPPGRHTVMPAVFK